jgi:hypothetical protein
MNGMKVICLSLMSLTSSVIVLVVTNQSMNVDARDVMTSPSNDISQGGIAHEHHNRIHIELEERITELEKQMEVMRKQVGKYNETKATLSLWGRKRK